MRDSAGRKLLITVLGMVCCVVASNGCRSNSTGRECNANDDCAAGMLCVDHTCKQVCIGDVDCPTGAICTDGLCREGVRTDVPDILSIDGNGLAICPDANGTHCLANGLLVGGARFTGATFYLDTPSGNERRQLRQSGIPADALAILELPDLPAGDYLLVATNAAGSDQAGLTLLQGPPGQDGSPDTGEQILAKLALVDGTGSGLDADRLDGVHLADLQSQLDALQAQLTQAMNMSVPTGTIVAFGGTAMTVPEGWLLCEGQVLSRSEYAALFAVISTNFGAPNGTQFNLPDLRGKFLRGTDTTGAWDPDGTTRTALLPGGLTGANVGSYQTDLFKSHDHRRYVLSADGGAHAADEEISALYGHKGAWGYQGSFLVGASGGNETRPKNVNVSYIIKD